jgi:hypothetical protein
VENLLRIAGETAWSKSADFGHMSNARDHPDPFPVIKYSFYDHVFWQMIHAGIGIVVQNDVTLTKPIEAELLNDPGECHGGRAELSWTELALADHVADLVEHRAGEVERLVEDGRVGGALHRLPHLSRDRYEVVGRDRHGHGVDSWSFHDSQVRPPPPA